MKNLPAAIVTGFLLSCPVLPVSGENVSFRRDIAPILLDNCLACHGPKKVEGGYRVDTFAMAVGEGDSGLPGFTGGSLPDSEVYRRIVSDDIDERMPLEGERLSNQEIDMLKRWIEEGAVFNGSDSRAPLSSLIPPPQHPDPPLRYPRPMPVTALRFSADGGELYAAGYHEVTVWNAINGDLRRRITNVDERTLGLALSPDASTLAVAGGAPGRRGEIRLFDLSSGELQAVLGPSRDVVMDVQFSPDGGQIAAAIADNRVVIFDAKSGEEVLVLTSHSDWATAVAWNSDGTRLASTSRDKTVKVFGVRLGDLLATYPGHVDKVLGAAFHPDGEEVFSSGGDNKIHRWTIEDAKKVAATEFAGDVFKIVHAGPYLFAASADGTVRQYDAQTLKEIRQYANHGDWAISVAYDVGSKRLAAGGYNGEIWVWDATDGTALLNFVAAPGHRNTKGELP